MNRLNLLTNERKRDSLPNFGKKEKHSRGGQRSPVKANKVGVGIKRGNTRWRWPVSSVRVP